jgi:hypothetical protein
VGKVAFVIAPGADVVRYAPIWSFELHPASVAIRTPQAREP